MVAAWAIGALLIKLRASRRGLKVVLSMKSLGGGEVFRRVALREGVLEISKSEGDCWVWA